MIKCTAWKTIIIEPAQAKMILIRSAFSMIERQKKKLLVLKKMKSIVSLCISLKPIFIVFRICEEIKKKNVMVKNPPQQKSIMLKLLTNSSSYPNAVMRLLIPES